ncbi:kinase-like protein [Rhizophagus irregularis]|uniref:Kinase-like protein n=2 Tax=Rhizophagus irregularis TaxID=588596 RepID=A0A2N0PV40_9GLOM|nr:kinase-like protein [Rhizophagus irregularis]
MSTTKEQTNDSEYVDWIKKEIENNNITYFNHNEFTNKQEFENSISSVGKIFKVNWSNNDNTRLIVKTPGLNVKKIINELKIRKEIDSNINILRIYGISRLDNKYSLVLEYADGGSLYSYLKENFTKLEWNDKYRLALQLASAVEYIHDKGIIHCNLHAHNVLIHKGHIKVADFGLSKKATETSNYSDDVLGTIPYIDPKYLSNVCDIQYGSKLYTLNFKSDIYSIGALFWLLSSGRRPFYDDESIKYDANLAMDIMMGKREKIIGGTPAKYSDLYTACWKNDPNERPSIQQVVLCLKSMIKQDINEEKNSTKFIKNVIEKEPSNEDFDNMMDNDYNFFIGDDFSNSLIDDDFDLNMNDIIQNNLLIDVTDSDDVGKIIDKLIDHLIKLHDELGYGFAGAKQIIEQNIKFINQPLDDILDWLNDNQISSKYIFFHGFLYFNGIIVKGDEDKAFASFSKASKDNYSMAQVYLCKLYKDPKKAFYWYQKSAENGNKLAQFYLGKWYENNEKDDLKAFECYEKAAKSGNKIAQLNLGYFYDHGKGTQRNKDKAIEWYEKSAKQECSNAQLFLGILYKGTKKDFKNAFYWVEKATKNGNRIAQFYLGKYYYFGTGVKKDYGKSFEWYEKSAKQGYIDALYALGYLYLKGKGTEKNLEKAHYLIEKAAENGNKFAQHHLGAIYQNDKGTKKNIKKAIEWYERSAEKGYSIAQCNLGYLYGKGKEIDQDLKKSLYWYEKAAKSGNKFAQYNLGYIYENGIGIQKDINKAIIWYEKSAKQDYGSAQCSLGYLYENGKGIDQDLEKSIYLYKKAAENGYVAAYHCLGKCYQDGIGIEKNEVKAFENYKKSAEKGYLNGIYNLGYCYENGIGAEIDKEKAVELYQDAAKRGNRDAQKRLKMINS